MNFSEALYEMKEGKKVTREKWEKDKTKRYKYIQIEHGKCIAFLKDNVLKDIYEGQNYMGCIFGYADFTAEDWKIYKEKEKNKSWKPKEGDTYFYISGTGKVISDTFMPYLPSDNDKVSFNNVFKTGEEAEHMLEKIKIINQLRKLSNIKFVDDCSKLRYSISYDVGTKKVCPRMNRYSRLLPFDLYFETAKDCQNAIDEIGEENLKKYYFDIVEEDN